MDSKQGLKVYKFLSDLTYSYKNGCAQKMLMIHFLYETNYLLSLKIFSIKGAVTVEELSFHHLLLSSEDEIMKDDIHD